MPHIARDFIVNRLVPSLRIEHVLTDLFGLALKKNGANFSCCCPFHNEKTPSFFVSPSKGTYHCFGCEVHGNVINFVMSYKNLTFVEAVEELAQYAGIEIEYDRTSGSDDRDRYELYYELMDRCAFYFSSSLAKNQAARDYWYQTRQFSRDTVLKARLGYAPDSWEQFLKDVPRNDAEKTALADLGMLSLRDDGTFLPMFRNRVMIPIINLKGKVISFGGRALDDSKPKYLNTRETPIFKKRRELFGLYEALQEFRNRPPQLVLVEGYLDVLSLRQAGILYAAASLGTATTVDHFKLMFHYTDKVICCYDGDAAGQKAAWHALEVLSPVIQADKEVRFAFLPQEDDPDSLVRKEGPGGFTRYLDNALSFPEFLVSHVSSGFDLADPGDRTRFMAEILPRIKRIAALPLRNVTAEILAKTLAMDPDRVYEMLNALSEPLESLRRAAAEDGSAGVRAELLNTPMRRLIAFLLQQPAVASLMYDRFELDRLPGLLQELGVKGSTDLKYLLDLIHQHGDITPAQFIEQVRDTKREKSFNLLLQASFIPRKADGGEYSIEDRAEFFSRIISECIFGALKYQQTRISLKGSEITKDDFAQGQLVTELLARRFDF